MKNGEHPTSAWRRVTCENITAAVGLVALRCAPVLVAARIMRGLLCSRFDCHQLRQRLHDVIEAITADGKAGGGRRASSYGKVGAGSKLTMAMLPNPYH